MLLAQLVQHQARADYAKVKKAITDQSNPPALEGAQTDAELAAGSDQDRAISMRLPDQLDNLAPERCWSAIRILREKEPSACFEATAMLQSPPSPSPCANSLISALNSRWF